jgi:hypothetical protein
MSVARTDAIARADLETDNDPMQRPDPMQRYRPSASLRPRRHRERIRTMDKSEIDSAIAALAGVLNNVDVGDIAATDVQRAYIEGSLATLRELAVQDPF